MPETASVIIPVYANANTLEELHHRLRGLEMAASLEIVFVNDASPDNSIEILRRLATEDRAIIVVDLSTNVGQQQAIKTGLRVASGDVIVVLDADLQDRPEEIPALLVRLARGPFEAVFAVRKNRYQSRGRMILSRFYRHVIKPLTGLPEGAGGYVAISRRMSERLLKTTGKRFYLAGLIGCSGYRVSALEVVRQMRPKGQSAYTGAMRVSVAISNIMCVLGERFSHGNR